VISEMATQIVHVVVFISELLLGRYACMTCPTPRSQRSDNATGRAEPGASKIEK
jgi:hypothetical protein